jgi:hypothetical protein
MIDHAPLVAANDWLGIIVPIVFFIIYALNQLLANKNSKGGQRPPQRREPQAERQMRPNPNAPPVANPQASRQQGGRPTPLDAEIEQFLRRADQRKGNRPQQKRAAQQQQPPKPPPKSLPREADISGPIAAEVMDDRGLSSVAASVEQHMANRGFAQRAEHLADDIARADQQMEEHLQKSFNRKVGTLDSTTQGRSATPLTDTAAKADTGPQSQASALAELLSNAQGVRQAVILSEILERPEHRW